MGVDILICSKDRPLQLHALLESMSRHYSGIGRLTISYQHSTPEYADAYAVLWRRLRGDARFARLAQQAEIRLHNRNSLSAVAEVMNDLGSSEYFMPMVDDDLIYRDYHLTEAKASRYFFEHPELLACCLRLGLEVTELHELHEAAIGLRAQPIFKIRNEEILVWNWAENLNVPHWSVLASVTSHMYRKKRFRAWFEEFGRESFLRIEGRVQYRYERDLLRFPAALHRTLDIADDAQMRFLAFFGIYKQNVFRHKLTRFFSARGWRLNLNVPVLMCAPAHSVVFTAELNRVAGLPTFSVVASAEALCGSYLEGKVIDLAHFPPVPPATVMMDKLCPELVPYFGGEA